MTRGIIIGRINPAIQLCPTCGRMRVHHPNGNLYSCPVPQAVLDAVRSFKATNGIRWKAKLRDAWTRGDNLGAELQQARNIIGPTRIAKIKL